MTQPIGSKMHGVLDYATAGGLLAASRLPGLRGSFAGRTLLSAAVNHLSYSPLTNYELGVLRKLPYKAHLALDAISAVGLMFVGLTQQNARDRYVPIAAGVFELGAVLLSDPRGEGA